MNCWGGGFQVKRIVVELTAVASTPWGGAVGTTRARGIQWCRKRPDVCFLHRVQYSLGNVVLYKPNWDYICLSISRSTLLHSVYVSFPETKCLWHCKHIGQHTHVLMYINWWVEGNTRTFYVSEDSQANMMTCHSAAACSQLKDLAFISAYLQLSIQLLHFKWLNGSLVGINGNNDKKAQ